MNLFLYLSTVLIWGSTWLAIYFQLGEAPVVVSVAYRFILAALLFWPLLKLTGRLQPLSKRDQGFVVLQGMCLFSLNFICFYNATLYIPSGLVSVIFSLATLYNALGNRLFYREKLDARVLVAGLVGLVGLLVLFLPELRQTQSEHVVKGVALAALGTLFFSLGNMISKRNSLQGLSPLTTNAYGMGYGSLLLCLILLMMGQTPVLPSSPTYWGALVYLSVFGSIFAFTAYLMLVARIGATRAAYATVLFPLVALSLSALFEGYQWSLWSLLGMLLVIAGNLIINGQLRFPTIRSLVRQAN